MTFQETLTQMWRTRPPRIPADQGGSAKIAGVAEGIGVRYQIDPTLVRIGFVVASLSIGGGVAAYLLAWLCMPRYGVALSPVQTLNRPKEQLDPVQLKERNTGWWLLIFFLLFSGVLTLGTGGIGATALLGIVALLGAWWGLHLKEPQPPAGLLPHPAPPMSRPVDLSAFTYPEGYETPHQTPPAWDPLGTAPFAWDLPEPPPREEPKKRPRVWPWLLGGFALTLLLASLAVNWVARQHYDIGSQHHTPTSTQQLETTYGADIGSLTLDLRELEPLTADRTVAVQPGIGKTLVYLPEEVPTTLICVEGGENWGKRTCDPGAYNDDAAGAELTLRVNGGQIGELEVIPTR